MTEVLQGLDSCGSHGANALFSCGYKVMQDTINPRALRSMPHHEPVVFLLRL